MAWRIRIVAVAALAFPPMFVPAQAQDEAWLRTAEELGTSLYQIDRAVQAAAKEGERSRAFRRDERVQGWVADVQPDVVRITYVGTQDGAPVGLYRAAVDRSGRIREALEAIDAEPLSADLAMQHAIGRTAREVQRTTCSNEVETLVLPADDGWHAYVLPRAAFADVYVLGGSYRIELSASGDAVTQVQALASECVIVQNKKGSDAMLFAEDRGLLPNELHVYISRMAGKAMYVTTTPNGRTWLIRDGRIHGVERIPGAAG
ncbi:MAG: hypothetical protein M9960_07855 [Xanthomonadaceae bacterium]|nr:hypothetical protein [Xanthomonadaceae bacterium]